MPPPPSGGRLALVLSVVVILGGASAIFAWSTFNRLLMGQGTLGEALAGVGAVGVLVALVAWLVRYLAPLTPPPSDAEGPAPRGPIGRRLQSSERLMRDEAPVCRVGRDGDGRLLTGATLHR